MHSEGWIFDIEMLMLAESAPATPVLSSDGSVIGTSPGIKVAEVPIDWHEVDGSKMNLMQDSVKMAMSPAVSGPRSMLSMRVPGRDGRYIPSLRPTTAGL
jgi:dolichyl-phosphate beta-glucosyltransferase